MSGIQIAGLVLSLIFSPLLVNYLWKRKKQLNAEARTLDLIRKHEDRRENTSNKEEEFSSEN